MNKDVTGIVVDKITYQDNTQIISIFTLEQGLIQIFINNKKDKKTNNIKYLFDYFCLYKLTIHKNKDFYIVDSFNLIDNFYSIRQSINKFYCASYVSQFIQQYVKQLNICYSDIFVLFLTTLKNITYIDINSKCFLLSFLINIIHILGYDIDIYKCGKCNKDLIESAYLSYSNSNLLCSKCVQCTNESFDIINNKQYKKLIYTYNNINNNTNFIYDIDVDFLIKIFNKYIYYKTNIKLNLFV